MIEMLDRAISDEAEVLAFEVEAGLCGTAEVQDWAYKIIGELETPPEQLLDLIVPRLHPTDAVHLLRDLSGARQDRVTLLRIFRRLGACLRSDPGRAFEIARILYRIVLDQRWAPYVGDLVGALYGFDDELELAQRGIYGDRAEVIQRMQAFLDDPDQR